MFLFIRPGLFEFLESLSVDFELVLFNNNTRSYTEKLVSTLLSQSVYSDRKFFSYILSKEQCSIDDSGHEIKNLDLFCNFDSNRELEDSLIVDYSIQSF